MKLIGGQLQDQLLLCRRGQWGLLGAFVILGGAIYLLGIRSASLDLDQANLQYSAARTELEQNQERAKNLPQVEQEIQRLRQRVERFDKTLPKQQDLASFINDVTKISQDALLRNLSWHLDSKPRRSDQFTELPIQFTFEGDFQTGIVPFLKGAEDMQRLTRVRKLDIKSSDTHDGQVKAEVTMNIYFGEE